jgi:type IV secretion system protein VirB2
LSYALPSRSLADPAGSSVLVAAVQWLQDTLLGTAAASVAAICIAWVGLMMLSGRIDLRRAATVILGCFILFGAASIAAGMRAAAGLADAGPAAVAHPVPASPLAGLPILAPPPPPAAPRRDPDPYAGAALPRR